MQPGSSLELRSVWEDEDLFEVEVAVSAAGFSGKTRCYTTRNLVAAFSHRLSCLSPRPAQSVEFETSSKAEAPYARIAVFPLDSVGHLVVGVSILEESIDRRYPRSQMADVAFRCELADIDSFAAKLAAFAEVAIGGSVALCGHD